MSAWSDFIARMKEAAPARRNETEAYEKFNYHYSWIAPLLMVAIAYATFMLNADFLLSKESFIRSLFPFLEGRMDFLKAQDERSLLAYTATVYSAVFTIPICTLIWLFGYWLTVISKRAHMGLVPDSIISVGYLVVVSVAFLAIAFVHVPETYDSRWPGMARILFWPVFPAFGTFLTFMASASLFVLIVFCLEIIYPEGTPQWLTTQALLQTPRQVTRITVFPFLRRWPSIRL